MDAAEAALTALQKATAISAAASGRSFTPENTHASSSTQELAQQSSSKQNPSERSPESPSPFTGRSSASSTEGSPQTHSHKPPVQQMASVDDSLSRTLVRSLVAQASILQSAGRLEEARTLLRQACSIDPAVEQLFLKPLEKIIGMREQ